MRPSRFEHLYQPQNSYKETRATMNINSLITFLLALSHANAARVRNTNSTSSQTSRARPSPTSPPLSPCQECRDGFRISTCVEIVQDGNSDNATGLSVGEEMNSIVACLLYTEGTHHERLTSTCTCNARTDSTDGNTYRGGRGGTLATTVVYLTFPCLILLMSIICCVRNRATASSAVRPEEEPDSNDARKQRECVLAILFPPSGGKVRSSHCSTFSILFVTRNDIPHTVCTVGCMSPVDNDASETETTANGQNW